MLNLKKILFEARRVVLPPFIAFAGTNLSACSLAPDYVAPPIADSTYSEVTTQKNPLLSTETADLSVWWQTFNDPILTGLIEQAVKSNLDLKQAEAKVREARALQGVAIGGIFPKINGNTSYSRVRISENGLPFGTTPPSNSNGYQAVPLKAESKASSDSASTGESDAVSSKSAFNLLPEFNLFQVGFDASWETDIFGSQRNQVASATAELEGTVDQKRGAILSLVSEVARNYVLFRGAQEERDLAEKNLQTQSEVLELTRNQQTNGVGTDLDVTRAEAIVKSTEAEIPLLVRAEKLSIHQLSFLLQISNDEIEKQLGASRTPPTVNMPIAVGIPSDLIRRRPDIRQAERSIASAAAQVGVAKANLYPQLSITGAFSFASAKTNSLFDWDSRGFSGGPAISIPLFQGGALESTVQVRNEQFDESLTAYQKAVSGAVREVQDEVVSFSTELERRESLKAAAKAQSDSLDFSKALYKEGLTDFLNVLEAERALYVAQDTLAQSEQAVNTHAIALYKALGGGWEYIEQKSNS